MEQQGNPKPDREKATQQPAIFINSIKFNDETNIGLTHNSIVVFTGPNNCGKSQVLKDIDNYFDKTTSTSPIVLSELQPEYIGSIDDSYVDEHFFVDSKGMYWPAETETQGFNKRDINTFWNNKSLAGHLNRLFIKLIDTEKRLITSKTLSTINKHQGNPIYKISRDISLANSLSEYFHQAFNHDLVVNKSAFANISLHVGNAPDRTEYTMQAEDKYYQKVEELPILDTQGDGMRSFTSIILDIFVSEYNIILIDEPEAFLHPPQARFLGKILAKQTRDNQQLFIATHSIDLLQGIINASSENVTVIHINRYNNINHMHILQNDMLKELWRNPLLRYTNIIDGLFHEKVIVCESDYDCLFYQAIIDAFYENRGEIVPDILFTHCGGKGRMKDIVAALTALKVPVVAVPDFDIINNQTEFRSLVSAFNLDWSSQFSSQMKIIKDWQNADPQRKVHIKKHGKSKLTGKAIEAYQAIEQIDMNVGLFVLPYGELECFDKTVNKQKRDWVYAILDRGNLESIETLGNARNFVRQIVEF